MAHLPDKAIHPGHVIARSLEREGMTQKNLSERTGLTEKHWSHIINGEASITIETALLLENALGGAASFWINLEKNYQETKARLERNALVKKESALVAKFPYAELVRRGYIERTTNREKKVENLWKFFGVNSLPFVKVTEAVAYRKRGGADIKSEAIAAWLRCGELEARKATVEQFSGATLKRRIEELRTLTTMPAEESSIKAREILAGAGASLIYMPHFPGTGVSGAVRWIGDNPVIQLSLLGSYADIFWFNLFHEIGHLLLHGKKEKFIEFDNHDLYATMEKEEEANSFASNILIPSKDYAAFIKARIFSQNSVRKFANSIQIDPGIVEGRLCREKVTPAVSWAKQLGFRKRLKFIE